jgi:hypothetical protein
MVGFHSMRGMILTEGSPKLLIVNDRKVYTLEFSSLAELTDSVRAFFTGSVLFEEVDEFLCAAQRDKQPHTLPLPGTSVEWMRFIDRNRERLR